MKVLMILTYYYPHWTGLTAYARRLAEGLAGRGHQVTVLTTRHSPSLARDEMVNGVRVVRLQPAARISRGMVTPAFPLAAARLIRMHDVVQIHTPMMESMLVAILCRLLGRPLVFTHHGDLTMPAGFFNKVVERVVTTMMTVAGMLATRVSSYSRDYADNSPFLRRFATKLGYILPPVEIPTPDAEAIAAWRRELGLEGKLLVGFAGRFVEEKGFDFLFKAMPLVRRQLPNAHFVFAGEHNVVYENFYARCLPLIEANAGHLTFLGLILDRQKLADFYGMCDLFVLPSRTDCLAIVQVEALLCGTPLVTSDIPGARIVVRNTGGGVLVPAGDVQALAHGICTVLAYPAAYLPSRDAVQAQFDGEQSLTQFEQLFADAIARGPGSMGSPASVEPGSASPPVSTAANSPVLDQQLRNESDVAFARRARWIVDRLNLQRGDRVLDCGCGMGFYLGALAQLGDFRLTGVDGDPKALAFAARYLAGQEVALARGDICCLPFAGESFDKLICSEVLEHLDDDRASLKEIHRVLRPGGLVAITVPNASYPLAYDPVNRILEDTIARPLRRGPFAGIWALHRRLYTREQLQAIVETAGFVVEECDWLTHFTFPFTPHIVYGLGKTLIQRGLLPDSVAKSADRFRYADNHGGILNPVNLGLSLLRAIDRLNDRPGLTGNRRAVNLVLLARKV